MRWAVQTDLRCIQEDIFAVEKHRIELYRARGRCLAKFRTFDDLTAAIPCPTLTDRYNNSIISTACNIQGWRAQSKKTDEEAHVSSQGMRVRDAYGEKMTGPSSDLQECHLQKQWHWTGQSHKEEEGDFCAVSREGYHYLSVAIKPFKNVATLPLHH